MSITDPAEVQTPKLTYLSDHVCCQHKYICAIMKAL